MIDRSRLLAAYETARSQLLEQRGVNSYWIGELSASALSTATAVSALAVVEQARADDAGAVRSSLAKGSSPLSYLIDGGIRWLARQQNTDGGWGDTDKSHSNIAATMLAVAAIRLAGKSDRHAALLERADRCLERLGRLAGLRLRYGKDKTFAAPILSNCALAGLTSWREVSPLPFELACLPQRCYRLLRLPVVSYAIPALVAIGLARYHFQKPVNPIVRLLRGVSISKSLQVLEKMQPTSGGYLEATPLTSFVVMNLAGVGLASHSVARRGVEFLQSSVRPDGSWPIDTNLATWNTTSALNALAEGGEDLGQFECLDWFLSCQHHEVHPFTGADPGGWGWSDLDGAVPDADDTAGALLALAAWRKSQWLHCADGARIDRAAAAGVRWLIDLQNSDGGWPTFCRGWGKLPFDRSGADLTAHAVRALHSWVGRLQIDARRVRSACLRGLRYLDRVQQADGSWSPLWFGNQDHPREENPIYGTAKVLLAYRDLGRLETEQARRGLDWLKSSQNEDGGWASGATMRPGGKRTVPSSVEETALAVEALLASDADPLLQPAKTKGLEWILAAVESPKPWETAPIGFYFAKLWYYEKLYPLIFTVSALGRARGRLAGPSGAPTATARIPDA